jgi:rhamnosyltransferase
MTNPNLIAISVLIRTFNSAKTLRKLLSSLPLSEGDEIVAVDSGSTDRTVEIAEIFRAKIILAPLPFNYSKSLNLGFKAARNSWVLVLSSHSLPQVPDLLGTFRKAIQRFPEYIVAGYGPSFADQGPKFPRSDVLFSTPEIFRETILPFCSNRNTVYRRSAWQALAFDETVRTAEDKIWATQIVEREFSVALVPAAVTLNISKYSLRYMFWKGYSETRSLPSQPMSVYNLLISLRSLLKRPLLYKMPLGNWIRTSAYTLGHFVGSRAETDNRPW